MADLPQNFTTSAILWPGATFSSDLDIPDDRDWIAISLTAGQWAKIDLAGTAETDGLLDPYITIYDAAGQFVAYDDDSGLGRNAQVQFAVTKTGTYYIEVAAFDSGDTGRYTLTAELSSAADITAPKLPDGPLKALGWGTKQADTTVTVYFAPRGDSNGTTVTDMTAYEKARFMQAFADIEAVANLDFVVTNDPDADFKIGVALFGSSSGFLGSFGPPGYASAGYGLFNGSAWDRGPGGDLEKGGNGYATIMHELLHGLGLAHPHDSGGISTVLSGVTRSFNDYGNADLNQGIFTTMSYNGGYASDRQLKATSANDYGYESGPMALDIAVLQAVYGVNDTYRADNSIYALPGANRAGTTWQTIWDTGGSDKIRFDGSRDVQIDLRAATLIDAIGGGGYISAADGIAGGFTIAHGVVIENATGGAGDDRLQGNRADNILVGRAGDDRIIGSTGDDNLFGHAGSDVLRGGGDIDSLRGNSGTDRLFGGSGDDVLRGGRNADRLIGGNGDDILRGGFGADRLGGGRGDDVLVGGRGQDRLLGGNGSDEMTGGQGADVFVFRQSKGREIITDFKPGQDTLNLRRVDANVNCDGGQYVRFIENDPFDDHAGQLRMVTRKGDTILRLDSDGDGDADLSIFLEGVTQLRDSDFVF